MIRALFTVLALLGLTWDVARASGTPRGADDAKNARLCDPRNPPTPLAFDHAEILADYVRWLETGEFPAPWRKRRG